MTVADRVRSRTEDVRDRAEHVRDRAERVQTRAMTWVDRVLAIGWIAHIQRAIERFNGRFGYQFGAGIAYFSVLAIIPVVLVAFSILGFFLTELRPQLIGTVSELAVAQFRNVDPLVIDEVEMYLVSILENYASITVVGLITGLYVGAAWMGHLRNAIDALWRIDFDAQRDLQFYPVKIALNLVRMAGLVVAISITFGLATISTSFVQQVATWLGFGDTWFTSALIKVLAPVLSLLAGWLTFVYIYVIVPREREPWRIIVRAAALGAIGLFAMQYLSALLLTAFRGNPAATLFGPLLVAMLFFNLFAQLILILASWIATWDEPAFLDLEESRVRFALTPAQPVASGPPVVTQENAGRAVSIGLGAGWLTGTAAGLGLGALLAWLLSRLSGRRPSR